MLIRSALLRIARYCNNFIGHLHVSSLNFGVAGGTQKNKFAGLNSKPVDTRRPPSGRQRERLFVTVQMVELQRGRAPGIPTDHTGSTCFFDQDALNFRRRLTTASDLHLTHL